MQYQEASLLASSLLALLGRCVSCQHCKLSISCQDCNLPPSKTDFPADVLSPILSHFLLYLTLPLSFIFLFLCLYDLVLLLGMHNKNHERHFASIFLPLLPCVRFIFFLSHLESFSSAF